MLMKKFGVAAALILCAFSASASNFRGADQVYIPAAGHATGSSGTFISDVYISNLSSEDVDVSVIYQAAGAVGGPGIEFPKIIKLKGHERKEYLDFFVSALNQTGNQFGQLIFNGCLKDQDCGPATQDDDGVSEHFRPIAVTSRIYQVPNPDPALPAPERRQTGQLFTGIPWYNFVSSLQETNELDEVYITGLTNTGTAGQVGTFRANIGLVNASQYSTTTLRVTLFQGTKTTADQKAQKEIQLGPLGSLLLGFNDAALFPGLTGANFFVTIEQINSNPTSDAPDGCTSGCPAFLAYGSVLDNASGDATTLEAVYLRELSLAAISVIYPNSSGKTLMRRSVRH
ncbi:MAG TPA: hypothetical protein VNA69_23425 [Thermoanaerobaculia bacterium]|nr:hypothetical protein [Thermoanaerobaculia bacterium]